MSDRKLSIPLRGGFWRNFWFGAALASVLSGAVFVGVGIGSGDYVLFLMAVFVLVVGFVSLVMQAEQSE